ncbi:zinc-binding alcohol dehydrogenase family protein [Lunatibacter salilacus]|uniref:zinc-binding alcohol dehydrogenase family protein n=1 Tax=Lunatibacter salilacus TaxID=2483804 RepID=UPI00131BEBFE|nr:zinc-binding alcohol dehydrogenase family protein [Lunatibacter salilacus]
MKYIVCEIPGKLTLKTHEIPTPATDEVLVKIRRIGICGTDLHAFAGNQAFFTYPRILGHELAGEIYDPNGNREFTSGDKVAIIPYINCGSCLACRAGKTNCCASLKVLGVHIDGGMQEIIAVSGRLLIPAPNLSWEEIAIIEPLCIAAHAVKRAQITPGQRILVIGCGPIGLAIIRFANLAGGTVIAMDLNEQRLQVAASHFGADHTLLAGSSAKNEVSKLTESDLCDVVFDATGNKAALESGVEFMGHGGKYLLVGLYKDFLSFHHPSLHAKETSILCSRNATKEDFLFVMETLAKKLFPTEMYVTHQVSFEQLIDDFNSWTDPANQVIKAMASL